MDYDPISVALKFGFLAVLYLFLLWIARSALKDLRRTVAPAPTRPGSTTRPAFAAARGGGDAWLIAERGGGLEQGERFDLIGGLSIGRSSDADVQIDDRYASSVHARDLQPRRAHLRRGHELDQRDAAQRRRRSRARPSCSTAT